MSYDQQQIGKSLVELGSTNWLSFILPQASYGIPQLAFTNRLEVTNQGAFIVSTRLPYKVNTIYDVEFTLNKISGTGAFYSGFTGVGPAGQSYYGGLPAWNIASNINLAIGEIRQVKASVSPTSLPADTQYIDIYCLFNYSGGGTTTITDFKAQIQNNNFQISNTRKLYASQDAYTDWLPRYDWGSLGKFSFNTIDRLNELSDSNCAVSVKSRLPFKADALYSLALKIKKLSGSGSFYAAFVGVPSIGASTPSVLSWQIVSGVNVLAGNSQTFNLQLKGSEIVNLSVNTQFIDLVLLANYGGTTPCSTEIEFLEFQILPTISDLWVNPINPVLTPVNTSVVLQTNGQLITKNSGVNNSWDADAFSNTSITLGSASFKFPTPTLNVMAGFSVGSTNLDSSYGSLSMLFMLLEIMLISMKMVQT
jgi:hypothetical protein